MKLKDEEGQMEAMADMGHSQATLGQFDAAKDLYGQSLELAVALEDLSGQLVARWGLADIAEIEEDYETAMLQLSDCLHAFINVGLPTPIAVRQRIELLMKLKDEEGQMEAMADMGHSQATLGQFDAAKDLYGQSLELAVALEDLSGQLVARWGLADIAEIEEDYETAMLQLSDCLHAFINAGLPTPIAVRQRIEALTSFNSSSENRSKS
jgi:tetratricopeptide (TPR) repeat protein